MLVVGFKLLLNTQNGRLKWDKLKLRIPVVGNMILTVASSRFTRTMSTLLFSGLPLLQSIEVTAKVLGNSFLSKRVSSTMDDIKKGFALSSALKKIEEMPAHDIFHGQHR